MYYIGAGCFVTGERYMVLTIKKATVNDGMDIYRFLQELPADENGFINSTVGKTYEEYRIWLKGAVANSEQQGVADGWKVPQSTYWLYLDDQPIGYGKIRHFLTDSLREAGGHIGISIRPQFRGRGYGKAFLALLKDECRALGIDELLCTIRNENKSSIRIALACGGILEHVTEKRHYITIRL